MHRTTRIFKSGNSLAIRIPKEFHLNDQQEVEVFQREGELVIRLIPKNLAIAFRLLSSFPEDFFQDGRIDLPPQDRDF